MKVESVETRATASRIHPMDHYVLIRPDEPARFAGRKGLIALPDVARPVVWHGVVVEAGPGPWCSDEDRPDEPAFRIPLDVKGGDRVYYGQYAGVEMVVGGEKLMLCSAYEIMAVLVGEGSVAFSQRNEPAGDFNGTLVI